MLVSSVVVLPQGQRCAVALASAFWRVFPELCLGGSGGVCLGVVGQGVVHLAVRPAAALARLPCCSFLSFSAALVGIRVSPWFGLFASFPVPGVLSQMVV
ncbi:hypothetical protein Taro_001148, partial [Colocasia esculenta]|nr:hypothetical protein [Colocasia esculenta]